MARVTVEDCTKIIPNRFELVVLASRRARDISSGSDINVERDNDKDAVIALREIADNKVSKEYLLDEVVSSYQSNQQYVAATEQETSKEVKEAIAAEGDVIDDSTPNEQEMFAGDNVEVDD